MDTLKQLIDMLDGAADIAGWVIAGYILYLTVLYLSTTGAVVFCVKLIVNAAHDSIKRRIESKLVEQKNQIDAEQAPKEWKLGSTAITEDINVEIRQLLDKVRYHRNRADLTKGHRFVASYLHKADMNWLRSVVEAAIDEETEKDATE